MTDDDSQASRRLVDEFRGTFDAEIVESHITDSRARLESRTEFAASSPISVERFTRHRLRALARMEVGTLDKPGVLFLCVHNAGRSQMGAGWLRHLAGDAVDVFSGGTDPGTETNKTAIEAMAEVGIDISDEHPQPWTDEIVRAADVVVSMGCGDACPVFPGKRYEDWALTDPSGQPIETVREIRDDIRARVEALIASLGISPA